MNSAPRTAADERAADLVSLSVEGSGRGEAWAYNLDGGRYFVTANSGCESWQFVLHPG